MKRGRLSKIANKKDFAHKAARTRRLNTKVSMMRGGPRF